MPVRALLVAALVALGLACDGDEEMTGGGDESEDTAGPTPVPLVDPRQWAMADEAEDVFADLRPESIECDPDRGVYVEELPWQTRFEINTAWCNYATVQQPLAHPLVAGDAVEVRVWHFELTGGPAQAYLAVALDGEVMWEADVPIPSESELVSGTFEVARDLAAGTPLQFHLHNHGTNTWELVSIDRL